ncbi:MAG: hypothetical protein MZU95_02780 [Desulfomicrobium escambiense]|nr:hypothetical protein [Desulfomicrobium escambiense]
MDLNNTSLRALKDYHPTRAHYARAIRNLGEMQAAVQMCDFIFAGETSAAERPTADGGDAGGRGDVVFGMAFRLVARPAPGRGGGRRPGGARLPQANRLEDCRPRRGPTRFYYGVDPLITLVPLAELSLGTGFLTLDARTRTGSSGGMPLIVRFEDGFYPELRAEIRVRVSQESRPNGSCSSRARSSCGMPSGRAASAPQDISILPVDPRGCMRINFAGPWGTDAALQFFGHLLRLRRPGAARAIPGGA